VTESLKKTRSNGNYCPKKRGVFVKKSSADACEGWYRKPSPQTQWDDILCKVHPLAARTCAIAFLPLDGALSPVCKRWDPNMDLAVEERPAVASSPASLYSRLSAP
jgi:hypothetical protein